MVKPPRNMQPEAVNLQKAGRAAGKAFEDDSFRNYMARKIDLQRKQFGLELPPDPRLQVNDNRKDESFHATGNSSSNNRQNDENDTPPTPQIKGIVININSGNRKRKLHHVTFAANVKDNEAASNKQKRLRRKQKGPMNHLLKKLKRRHGRGLRTPKSAASSQVAVPNHPKEKLCEATSESSGEMALERGVHAVQHGTCNASEIQHSKIVATMDCQLEHVDNGHSEEESATMCHVDQVENCVQEKESAGKTIAGTNAVHLGDDDDSDQETGEDDKQTTASSLTRSPQVLRDRPDLFFYGVVVLVNGYTDPDTETLQRLLHKHGGHLEKYETSRITHIIAEHLSTAKANIYKKMRRPVPVVNPRWIVQSVKAGRLLPHGEYLIEEVKDNVASMRSFLKPVVAGQADNRNKKSAPVKSSTAKQQIAKLSSISSMQAGQTADVKYSQDSENSLRATGDPIKNPPKECASTMRGEMDEKSEHQHCATKHPSIESEQEQLQPKFGRQDEELPLKKRATPASPPVPMGTGRTDDKYINGQVRTVGTDPNFLDTFFNNSRLSFIGSYKQRIQESPKKQVHEGRPQAVVINRSFPQFKNKPVAISHFGKTRNDASGDSYQQPKKDSSSECATCNYEARKYGIKKGMFLGRAKELCPHLIILPYDFAGYEEVSAEVASILQRHVSEYDGEVEQVSCDESYFQLDLPMGEGFSDPHRVAGDIANRIREEILDATKCTATIGVGANKFLAKLATDRVKPNGSFVVRDHKELLRNLKLKDLHGIGYRTEPKLIEEGLVSVQDVWDLGGAAEGILQRVLGPGLGKKIAAFCKGQDDRPVKDVERKTIGAECNYGVRFDGPYGVDHMIAGLAKEVQKRMEGVGVRGSRVTLKVKQRKKGAKPPPKFLGHGSCHNLSKSLETSGGPTRDWKIIFDTGVGLLALMNIDKDDIRGMGIILSKLVSNDKEAPNHGITNPSIKDWFGARKNENGAIATMKTSSEEKHDCNPVGSPPSPMLVQEPEEGSPEAADNAMAMPLSQIDKFDPHELPREAQNDPEKIDQERIVTVTARNDNLETTEANEEVEVLDDMGNGATNSDADFCDVALPPMSQIHLSQVEELPSPLKKQIKSKIARRRSEEARQSTKGKEIQADSNGRLLQVELKRLFRLQQMKNDNSGESELENLPLTLQLQVANNDERPLGHRSDAKRKSNSGLSRRNPTGLRAHAIVHEEKASSVPCSAGKNTAVSEPSAGTVGEEESLENAGMDSGESERETDATDVKSGDFFHENVFFLSRFMDENPAAYGDALQEVTEFLCICVREGRLRDAVLLLRNVRNRSDNWGTVAFGHLFMCVDDMCDEVEGYRLDFRGLGLMH